MSGDTRTNAFSSLEPSPCAASAIWEAFRDDPRGHPLGNPSGNPLGHSLGSHFHLAPEIVRDAPLDISAITRVLVLHLDHCLDQVSLASVPGQVTVHFLAPRPLLYQTDRRDIALVPSQEEFLGWHGLLPAIDVKCSHDPADDTTTWEIHDAGNDGVVRFVFAPGAAPLARASLGSLEKAAGLRREACEQMIEDLRHSTELGLWSGVRRTAACNFWKDLPERIRQRVRDYFRCDARAAALLSGADIGAALKEGSDDRLVTLAGEMLLAGLQYWTVRRCAHLLPDAFWCSEMERDVPFHAKGLDFAATLDAALEVYANWLPIRQFWRDVLQELDRAELASDPQLLQQRLRLSRALLRAGGQRVSKAGNIARDTLDSVDPAQVRQRLASAMHYLPGDAEAPSSSAPVQALSAIAGPASSPASSCVTYRNARLEQVLRIIIAPPAILLMPGDVVNETAMLRAAVDGDHGSTVVAYALDQMLAPQQIPTLFELPTGLLANGGLPLQLLHRDDGGPDGSWRRVYRFNVVRRFDEALESWVGSAREVTIQGSQIAQREALDMHIDGLLTELVTQQQAYLARSDKAVIVIDGYQDVILPPISSLAERRVRFVGRGGSLSLPAQLRGSVFIDSNGLDAEAPPPLLHLAPALAQCLQPVAPVVHGARRFAAWHTAANTLLACRLDDVACCQAIAAQIEVAARCGLRADLCNPALQRVTINAAIAGDIELPPMGRDVALHARAAGQRFVLRRLGSATTRLCIEAGLARTRSVHFVLSLALRQDKLPRYSVSRLERQDDGSLAGQVRDEVGGGCLHLVVQAGATFDQGSWEDARGTCDAVRAQALADVQAWDASLVGSGALDAGQLQEIALYGAQLDAVGEQALQRKVALLQAQWECEAGPAWSGPQVVHHALQPDAVAAQRLARARQTMCQVIVHLCRHELLELDDAQWRRRLSASAWRQDRLPLARVLGMAVLHRWQQQGAAHIYGAAAAWYRCQAMLATHVQPGRQHGLDQATQATQARADADCIDAALTLLAKGTVMRADLAAVMLDHLGSGLFDRDRGYRRALINDLQPLLASTHGGFGQGGLPQCLSTITGSQRRDDSRMYPTPSSGQVMPARDVLVFSEVCIEQGKGAGTLLFVGDLLNACPSWQWRDGAEVDMDFRWIDGLGWIMQPAGHEPATVLQDGPAWGVGDDERHYLLGATRLALETQGWLRVARSEHAQLVRDLAGNSYLLVGTAAGRLMPGSRHDAGTGAMCTMSITARLALAGGMAPASSWAGRKVRLLSGADYERVLAQHPAGRNPCAAMTSSLREAVARLA